MAILTLACASITTVAGTAGARPGVGAHARAQHRAHKRPRATCSRYRRVRRCHRARTTHPAPAKQTTPRTPPMSPSPTIAVPTPPAVPAVCPDTELMPAPDNIARVRAATLCLINQQRIAADELALAPNRALAQAAQAHDDDMVAHDYFAHNGPAGDTPLSRILSTGYIVGDVVGYVIGENIAWGTYDLATPAAIVTAWMSSPEHRANILDACFRDTAIAVDPEAPHSLAPNDPGAIYDQEFGVLRWPPLRQRRSGGVAPAASHG